jgi:hypothetical protein
MPPRAKLLVLAIGNLEDVEQCVGPAFAVAREHVELVFTDVYAACVYRNSVGVAVVCIPNTVDAPFDVGGDSGFAHFQNADDRIASKRRCWR